MTDRAPFGPSRTPSRPVTIADRRAPLAAARREGRAGLPGATALWVFAAIVVFGVAVGLAFALNGDDATPEAAVAAQPETEQPDGAPVAQGATQADPAADSAAGTDEAPATQAQAESPTGDPSAEAPAADADPQPVADADPLLGFTIPIAGACVPQSELLLPGSPRAYRNGIHEGVDFYSGAVGGCPAELIVTLATPILAAKAGIVIRADWDYLNITQAELDAAAAAGFQGLEILDRFRGRQVWIDHSDGVVTRYAHLSAIAAGLAVGQTVEAGQIIAFAGESGTPESVQAPGTDVHGHFEIRVGDGYLGEGLAIGDARFLYLEAFGVLDTASGG